MLESNNVMIVTSKLILVVLEDHDEEVDVVFENINFDSIECCQFDYKSKTNTEGSFILACKVNESTKILKCNLIRKSTLDENGVPNSDDYYFTMVNEDESNAITLK